MTHATLAVLPGDGIGPEVVAEALKVLRAVGQRFGHTWTIQTAMIGGAAIDATGVPLPPDTLATCQASDAVLLGAVGGPQWETLPGEKRPESGLLAIRKALGLYANIRPVAVFPALASASPLKADRVSHVDLVVVRELTGGIYFGDKTISAIDDGERASDLCVYTTSEIERIVRLAATLARQRQKRLVSVDKANVLETSRLWRRVTTRVLETEFPDVQYEHILVDACAMHLIRRPSDFDVIVTENMFGDILTDEASMIAGSIGLLPSASLGAIQVVTHGSTQRTAQDVTQHTTAQRTARRLGLYEPIHGSAPDIAGQGIANPIGTILSIALLLRYSLSLDMEARVIETAVADTITDGYLTADLAQGKAYTTSEVGSAIVERVVALHQSHTSAY